MKQIRIECRSGIEELDAPQFRCGWMEASLMNRWMLKVRLSEAVGCHGEGSHWIETRDAPAAVSALLEETSEAA